jgi:hypothetical protein
MRTMQSKPADAIINDLFIPDSFPGGYLMVVFAGAKRILAKSPYSMISRGC